MVQMMSETISGKKSNSFKVMENNDKTPKIPKTKMYLCKPIIVYEKVEDNSVQ